MKRTETVITVCLITLAVALTIIDIILVTILTSEVEYSQKRFARMTASEMLMKSGARDNRPCFVLDDEEEMEFRWTYLPSIGISQEHEMEIPVTGGTYSENQYITDLLYYLPSGIKNYLLKHHWKIVITDKIDDVSGHVSTVIGHTDIKAKVITITMDDPYTIYHEIGHIIEKQNNRKLKSDKIDKELETLYCHSAQGTLYIYMNREEQICESLFDYIWYPKEMQEQAPELYRIFNNYLDEEPYKAYNNIKD